MARWRSVPCPRRLGALGVAALLAAVLSGTATGQSGPDLAIVTPTSPAALDFQITPGGQPSARLTLGVANATSAPVAITIHLRDTTSAADVALGTTAPGGLSLLLVAGDLTIPAHDTGVLIVAIALPVGADAGEFAGILTVAAGSAGPATLALSAKSVPAAAEGARVDPSAVTMTATRLWPSLLAWSCDCWLGLPGYGAPRYTVTYSGLGKTGPLPKAEWVDLSSDTGGRLNVRQEGPSGGSTVANASIVLGAADRAGKYSGSLSLDPTIDKSPAIALTVNVQDLFVWPLLVLVLGAGVGWWLGRRRDRGRPKDILVLELAKIRDRYVSAAVGSSAGHLRWLPSAFSIPKDGKGPGFDPQGLSLGDLLYRRIRGARTLDELTGEIARAVTDVGTLVDEWMAAGAAADALQGRVALHRPFDPSAGVFAEADDLLGRTEPLADLAAATEFHQKLSDQSEAVETFVAARAVYRDAASSWATLTDQERDALRLKSMDPTVYWEETVRPARTLEELQSSGAVARLRDMDLAIANELARGRRGRMELVGPAVGAEPLERVEGPIRAIVGPVDRRSPAAIELEIERRDLFDFGIVAAVTTLVFFLSIYVDKNFGGGWQYLAAFLAGASSELAINWKLLPWYRSYRSAGAAEGS